MSESSLQARPPDAGSEPRLARKVEERSSAILDCLAGGQELAVDELIAQTGASPATIRRDLRRLEQQGVVRRAHGIVALAESSAFQPFLGDPGFRERLRHNALEKRRIGAAAADLVEPGDTIAVAPGTTTAQMTRPLKGRRSLTVVTNALNVAMDLSRTKNVTVHLAGGYLGGNWLALLGPKAVEFISSMFTKKLFFGANGVHPVHGITDEHPEEAAANEALARHAQMRIVLADHTKFGHTAKCLVCRIADVDMIVTDSGASDAAIAPFQQLGIKVLRV